MLIVGIFVVAGFVIAGAVVLLMVPEERRLRQADERARGSHRAADIWAVCREGMGSGAEVHYSIVVHLRPMRRAEDLPAMRVIPRSPLVALARRRDDPFDRRYRIASRETARARALVTEEVRAQTLEMDLGGWQLQDRILTVLFPELRDPDALEDRLSGLVRLAKQVAGPPAPAR